MGTQARRKATYGERMTHVPPTRRAKALKFAWFWGLHGPWSKLRRPGSAPVPVLDRQAVPPAPMDSIRVTWAGHASTVLQMGGKTLLLDPVWSTTLPGGIKRLTPPGVPWEGLPEIDGVLVSHNHYDHLDLRTLRRLPPGTPLFVPHGVGAWLRTKGFANVTELDWHESAALGDLTVTLVPAHHWSRRGLRDICDTLWGGWVVDAGSHRAYFAGDTGYGPCFREIGERYPGIDVAILPIGAYAPRHYNGGAHIDPEEAVRAFQDLGAKVMVPVHWGTFRLSPEPVSEPIEWLHRAWAEAGLPPTRLWSLAIGASRSWADLVVLDKPKAVRAPVVDAGVEAMVPPQTLPGRRASSGA